MQEGWVCDERLTGADSVSPQVIVQTFVCILNVMQPWHYNDIDGYGEIISPWIHYVVNKTQHSVRLKRTGWYLVIKAEAYSSKKQIFSVFVPCFDIVLWRWPVASQYNRVAPFLNLRLLIGKRSFAVPMSSSERILIVTIKWLIDLLVMQ